MIRSVDRSRAFALCVLTFFMGCDCDNQALGPATVERQLIVESGSGQSATATLPLAQPLIVTFQERTVRSGVGNVAGPWSGVYGISVSWSSPDGGTFSSAASTTDANGRASTMWTPARATLSSTVDARVA